MAMDSDALYEAVQAVRGMSRATEDLQDALTVFHEQVFYHLDRLLDAIGHERQDQ